MYSKIAGALEEISFGAFSDDDIFLGTSNHEKHCSRNVTKRVHESCHFNVHQNPLISPRHWKQNYSHMMEALHICCRRVKWEGFIFWFVFFGGNRGPHFQPHWGNPTPPEVIETIFWLVNYLVKLVR